MKLKFEIDVEGAAINEVSALITLAIQIQGVKSYLMYSADPPKENPDADKEKF